MKDKVLIVLIAISLLLGLSTCKSTNIAAPQVSQTHQEVDLLVALRALGIHVQSIHNDHPNSHIQETYELFVPQLIDHKDESKGYFDQRVFLSHTSTQAPMVMYLSGYNANSNRYLSEPAIMLEANQIHVEHRYFGESKRGDMPLEYLNIEQSAADHHHIVALLSQVYTSSWLNTGISKGGQTTMYHRYFYPEDVEASVVYVAPLNLALQDPRIDTFLDNVGTKECRNKVLAFQMELLLNYDLCLSMFQEKSTLKGYNYPMGLEKAFELSIFEYGFAFWQWSADCDAIPLADDKLSTKVDHLFTIDAPGFFTDKTITDLFPFFYQSYTEMGMYGYRVSPFGSLPREYREDFSNYRTFIPNDMELIYDGSVHQQVNEWLNTDASDMVFIYGEYDPWSSTSYTPNGSNNLFRKTIDKGSHASRIGHLPKSDIAQIKDSIQVWINPTKP